MSKRPSSPNAAQVTNNGGQGSGNDSSATLIKRARHDEQENTSQMIVSQNDKGQGLVQSVQRTSGLIGPTVLLEGHGAEIFDVAFDQNGENIATASKDKTIALWKVYGQGENQNYGVLRGPTAKSIPLAVKFSRNAENQVHLIASFSCGALLTYKLPSGEIIRRHRAAKGPLNSFDINTVTSRELIVAGGDDGKVRIWDVEQKEAIEEIDFGYSITAVSWSSDGQEIFLTGLDNDIHAYDLRAKKVTYSLRGHTDTPTSLSLSPDGSYLMSIANDSTVRIWDVRPFAPVQNSTTPGAHPRLYRTLIGTPAGYESWVRRGCFNPVGDRVIVGGADRTVNIYEVETSKLLYKLPGHTGTVISATFHPKEPVIASAGVDSKIYVGELTN